MPEELRQTHTDMVATYKLAVQERTADSYMLTIARDGESPVRSIYFYGDAIDATNGYNAYKDWGFAKDFLTVELHEPTGRVHSKVLRRPRGGECVFHREQYRQITDILAKVGQDVDESVWNYLTHELARIFSKDNQRFDQERFLAAVGFRGEINDRPIEY